MSEAPPSAHRLPVLGASEPGERDLRPHRDYIPVGEGAEVEIQMGHMCNNRCRFCVSGLETELRRAGPQQAEPVIEALRHARSRGARRVTLLGGEPTLQPSFMPALREAVTLGFDEIVIFTNGVKTSRRAFCEEVVELGNFLWRFSIQGGNEAAHDAVTEKPGSFARMMAGVRHLGEMGQEMTANACINEYSYRSAPDYVGLVRDYGLKQLHLDIIRPSDAGERTDEHLRSIMSRYSDMAVYFEKMLEGFEDWDPDFDVNLGNFPFCLLPGWSDKIHHDGRDTATVSADGDGLSKEWNKYEDKRFDKIHPPTCEDCVFRPRCSGVFTKYLQFYGDEEFQAVTPKRLSQVDPKQRAFGLHIAPLLQGLERMALPAGWRAAERVEDDREYRVRWRFVFGSEHLWVHFVRPDRVGDRRQAIHHSPRLAVQLGDMSAGVRTAAPALLRWLRAALEGGGRAESGRPRGGLEVPRDITVPLEGSNTAHQVLSASLRQLLMGLRRLPRPRAASGREVAEWDAFAALLASLTKSKPGALASVFRWTHVSTLARCVARRHKLDATTTTELRTLVCAELWALRALDKTVELREFAPRWCSLKNRATWVPPDRTRRIVLGAEAMLCLDESGNEIHRVTRDAWLAADGPHFERAALPVRGSIALVLEDNNPIADWEAHPDKLGNELNLGGKEAEAWVESIDDALGLIEAFMPVLYEEMQLFVQRIVPVGYDEGVHLSASYAEAIGTIYLSLHPNRMVMAEALIHEFSHNKLNALFEVDPVLTNAFTSLHSSPVRPDPRPLHGVLLAAHAFLPVAKLYERMLEAEHPRSQSQDFMARLSKIVASNHEAVSVVLDSGEPTPIGRGLLDELGRLDRHFMARYHDAEVGAADLG